MHSRLDSDFPLFTAKIAPPMLRGCVEYEQDRIAVSAKTKPGSRIGFTVGLALIGAVCTPRGWSEDLVVGMGQEGSSGKVILHFPGESGSSYLIQESVTLTDPWSTVDALGGEQGLLSWTNSPIDRDVPRSGFYRIEHLVPVRRLGDIDRDGQVDSMDVEVLDQFIHHEKVPADHHQFARSDLNADGMLDDADAKLLQTLIQGQSFVTISSPLHHSVLSGRRN